MKILGIDEAGRGCVLGDLFVGAYCCTEEELIEAKKTGVTDSKKLSPKKRNHIFAQLQKIGSGRVIQITPEQIDAGNINTLEEEAFAKHIIHYAPDVVYIDAPAHPKAIPAFQKRLFARIKKSGIKLPTCIIEPKADLTYPIVGQYQNLQSASNQSFLSKTGRRYLLDCLDPNAFKALCSTLHASNPRQVTDPQKASLATYSNGQCSQSHKDGFYGQ